MSSTHRPQTSFYSYLHMLQIWFCDVIATDDVSKMDPMASVYIERFKDISKSASNDMREDGEALFSELQKSYEAYRAGKGDSKQAFSDAFEAVMALLYSFAETQEIEELIDSAEGTFSELIIDYKREMERFTREGKPFCIAYLRPDGEKITLLNSSALFNAAKQQLRGFDTVYFSNDKKDVILLLKQTDKNGAMRFLKRLLGLQKDNAASFSGIVHECVAGEPLEDALKNITFEMASIEEGAEGIIDVLRDLSPLQRNIKTVQ